MKFSGLAHLALLASVVSASPTKVIEKRAAINDPCNIGYCTQNGGTTGGAGGKTVTVTTLDQLQAAVTGNDAAIVVVQGKITGAAKVTVGSNKTIVGKSGSALEGIGLTLLGQKNVIIRNMAISKVKAAWGDAITINLSKNVWVDHCDLSATREGNKDEHDGLVDLSHAADFVTISHNYFHDHSKGSLVGHSDKNGAEDKGTLRVTYANNHWFNIRSRGPLLRFGTAHIYNSYFDTMDTGLNSRMGAQALIQSSLYENSGTKAIFSESSSEIGYVVAEDVVLTGKSQNQAQKGTLTAKSPPYTYSLVGSANVKAAVVGKSGQTLGF
ncbi:pectate lyase [Plectosphaerella cucumerina]|uniref:pectate lyase n=1 Tax=Plectosphaerella cucumerina TaxID=40658 RepID=A0A8K0X6B5_9PEZI|nr:pectate lyase [Plectosphaerella cucumerina]